jgi:hypothetical protein
MAVPDLQTLKYPKKFEELCNQLIVAEYPQAVPIEGAGGDEGVDCLLHKKTLTIFQIKYFTQRLTYSHFRQIKESLNKAFTRFSPNKWALLLPKNPTIQETRRIRELASELKGLKIEIWSETKINNLLAKHPEIIKTYFPEIYLRKYINEELTRVPMFHGGTLQYLSILEKIWSRNISYDEKRSMSQHLYKRMKGKIPPNMQELKLIYPAVEFELFYIESGECRVRCKMHQLNISDEDIDSETFHFFGAVPMKDDEICFSCWKENKRGRKQLIWNFIESTLTNKTVEYYFSSLKPLDDQIVVVVYCWQFPRPMEGLRWNDFVVDCFIGKMKITILFPKGWDAYQIRTYEKSMGDSKSIGGAKKLCDEKGTIVQFKTDLPKFNPFDNVSCYSLNVILKRI